MRTGKGFLLLPNNDTFDGDFLSGFRHGSGKYFSQQENSSYEGHWELDEKHGYGEYRFPDGSFIKGTWEKGWMKFGTIRWANGVEYHGEFLKN